jgi:hypothetical protein
MISCAVIDPNFFEASFFVVVWGRFVAQVRELQVAKSIIGRLPADLYDKPFKVAPFDRNHWHGLTEIAVQPKTMLNKSEQLFIMF